MPVTFKPAGFRDVYWCARLNEPVIVKYKTHPDETEPELWCDGCDCPIKGNESDHPFMCHIVKPGTNGASDEVVVIGPDERAEG